MKPIFTCADARLLLACVLIPTAAISAADSEIQTLFNQGREAYYKGQIEQARQLLSQVLTLNPKHFETRAILASINANDKPDDASLRKQYASVIIPKFDVAEATLSESLQALSIMAGNASGGKVKGNFIVRNPELGKTLITLSMSNVPMDELLRYLAEMSKARLAWDKHAVVFNGIAD